MHLSETPGAAASAIRRAARTRKRKVQSLVYYSGECSRSSMTDMHLADHRSTSAIVSERYVHSGKIDVLEEQFR
jgi:hypothetical protein